MSLKSSEKVETNVYQLTVSVDGATFDAACTKAYNKVRKQISIPGFRKGKATRGMVERFYGEGAFYEDAFEIVFPEAVEAAVKEAGIEIVDNPFDVDVTEIGKDGCTWTLKVTVKPEVKVEGYKGLAVEKPSEEVTDEDIAAEIEQLQKRQARYVEVEGAAENGNMVTIDFDGSVDGVPFDGGKADGYELVLGSGQFIPGFEDQIVGHKAGDEFDVNVTFPEEYVEDLAGKDAVFAVKLITIKKEELPELDDDFAMDVSEFDTLDELKASTKEALAKKKADEAETAVETALYDQLVDLVEGEIPEVMYENQIDESVNEFGYQLQSQGIDLKTYLQFTGGDEQSLRDNFRDQAVKQVKVRLALEAIAAAEKLEVTAEDLDAKYKELAELYTMEEESLRKIISEEDLSKDVLSSKALEVVKDNAKIGGAKPAKKAAKKPAAKKAAAKKDAPEAEVNLAGMTKAQLQEYAAEKGIEVKASMTKAVMIETIEAAK